MICRLNRDMKDLDPKAAGASTTAVVPAQRPTSAADSRPMSQEGLVHDLAEEMRRRWEQGDFVRAEEFLSRHPELWAQPEEAIELIYEELCLRQQRFPADTCTDLGERFPQWRTHLEVMRECHRLLEPQVQGPSIPEVGTRVGDFHLLKLLGRGAAGSVFLANQPNLADRPVVVKLTAVRGQEHLHLARLQHTHIVPLYGAYDDPGHNLRVLCMPYFGGMPLDQLLDKVGGLPLEERTGERLLEVLRAPDAIVTGSASLTLSRLSFTEAVAWIGLCLAEALYYAHETGLIHFDLKPSNVLLAADGQPMLLDFHLAREPVDPDGLPPDYLGGTAGFMPPEQQSALVALAEGKPIAQAVDHRADIFALGAILYQALGGRLPYREGVSPALCRFQPSVSPGLSDIVAKCLAADADRRYRDAGALAADLRRHLHDQPLVGVRNRSLTERYRKWRRRRPSALRTVGLVAVVMGALGALTFSLVGHWSHLVREAEFALKEGRRSWQDHQFPGAEEILAKGLENVRALPWHHGLVHQFQDELQRARGERVAYQRLQELKQLHVVAEEVRGLVGLDHLSRRQLVPLEETTHALWNKRRSLVKLLAATPPPDSVNDLIEVALFAADVQARLAPQGSSLEEAARRRALDVVDELEALVGPSLILQYQRECRSRNMKSRDWPRPNAASSAKTAWEHCVVGRSLLEANDLDGAFQHLRQAQILEPHGFWPNFYQGLCAYRLGRHADALTAFGVCIGASPGMAAAYYNRALAYTALKSPQEALTDYDAALRLDSNLAAAALNRGMLHFEADRLDEAQADLQRALALGADPATVHYDLAMVQVKANDLAGARSSLQKALEQAPNHPQARALLESIKR
jgi:serine/threonine protein kinase/Flp pilus assembly protein TadD